MQVDRFKLEANLVCIVSSRIARAKKKDPVSKTKSKPSHPLSPFFS